MQSPFKLLKWVPKLLHLVRFALRLFLKHQFKTYKIFKTRATEMRFEKMLTEIDYNVNSKLFEESKKEKDNISTLRA